MPPQGLRELPFTWARELTAPRGDRGFAVCAVLEGLGVHGQPLWLRECRCGDDTPIEALALQDAAAHRAAMLGFLSEGGLGASQVSAQRLIL